MMESSAVPGPARGGLREHDGPARAQWRGAIMIHLDHDTVTRDQEGLGYPA
jgi:hypothetical protein